MRFSIIIPVYNVEKYIDRCLDTVMHQTFDDYEVIVVNDETPDNSMQIVQKYVDEFPGKIQVIHQKNTRQGGARNNGVSRAKGEYLLFVDSDDYVALNMLETLDAKLKEQPCDILGFRHITVTPEGKELYEYSDEFLKPGIYDPSENKEIVMLACQPWGKAFRCSFYVESKFLFPEKMLYEDAVTRVLYASAASVVLCEDKLYYYVQSPNSSIRRTISDKMLDILPMTDLVLCEFQKRGLYEKFREPLDCALIYGILYIANIISQTQPNHPFLTSMADYIREHFPDYKNNTCIGDTLCRALDYFTAYNFRKYHFRILFLSRIKENLLRIPAVKKLNEIRHR